MCISYVNHTKVLGSVERLGFGLLCFFQREKGATLGWVLAKKIGRINAASGSMKSVALRNLNDMRTHSE
jgi:hypothetical protein